MKKAIHWLALIVCVVGVIMFFVGATTGTYTGYEDAFGVVHATSEGSRDWMGLPGALMAILGGVVFFVTKQ